MSPEKTSRSDEWMTAQKGALIAGVALGVLFVAYYMFRDTTADAIEIKEAEMRVETSCQPLFSSMIHYEVLARAKPLDEKDVHRIERRLSALTDKECEKMIEQITKAP